MYNKILKTVELQKLNKRFSYNSNKSIGERGAKISGGQNQSGVLLELFTINPQY